MKFPLYYNDGKPAFHLSEEQKYAISAVLRKLGSGEYKYISLYCICNNEKEKEDLVVAEKDRYGFFIRTILCSKCGLLRSAWTFDQGSNRNFYANEYRSIYVGGKIPPESFYSEQTSRGEALVNIVNGSIQNPLPGPVFEAGCGAGGILASFAAVGWSCAGSDFDENYLEYGRNRGLELHCGDFSEFIKDNSVGLFILSHVLEHIADPAGEVINITRKIAPGGYLLVEVPGIFSIHKIYSDPLLYLQGAHTYSFTAAHLRVFFSALGLEIIRGDERCIFIARKPFNWNKNHVDIIYDPCLNNYPMLVKRYLTRVRLLHVLKMNPYFWKQRLETTIRLNLEKNFKISNRIK